MPSLKPNNVQAARERTRVPITVVAVGGLGALVALAVGLVLYVGIASGTENTRQLLRAQGQATVDYLEQRIHARLGPAIAQSRWVVAALERGELSLAKSATRDAFMLGALAGTPQIAGIAFVSKQGLSTRWV